MSTSANSSFSVLNQFFDHIYVLTLHRATDRQANIKNVLSGLDWSFFYGCDKQELNMQQVVAEKVYDDALHRKTKRTARSMSLGEIACSISHKRIYQDMLTNGYKNALILEDDVLPIPDNLKRFGQICKQLPADWEVLMLGYYNEKLPTPYSRMQQSLYRLFKLLGLFNWGNVSQAWLDSLLMQHYSDDLYLFGKVLGAHAYAINTSAAEKFVKYQTQVKIQADRIFHYGKADMGINGFASKQRLFTLSELSEQSYIND